MNYFWAVFFIFLSTFIVPFFLILTFLLKIPGLICNTIVSFITRSSNIGQVTEVIILTVGQKIIEIYAWTLGVATAAFIILRYGSSTFSIVILTVFAEFMFIKLWRINTEEKNRGIPKNISLSDNLIESLININDIFQHINGTIGIFGLILFVWKPEFSESMFSWVFKLLDEVIPHKR